METYHLRLNTIGWKPKGELLIIGTNRGIDVRFLEPLWFSFNSLLQTHRRYDVIGKIISAHCSSAIQLLLFLFVREKKGNKVRDIPLRRSFDHSSYLSQLQKLILAIFSRWCNPCSSQVSSVYNLNAEPKEILNFTLKGEQHQYYGFSGPHIT